MPTLLAPESTSACSWLAHAWTPKACAVVCPLPASGALPQAPRCSAFLLSLVLFSVFCFFFFYVGRSFISVAIVADLHVRCPQFQRQQKRQPRPSLDAWCVSHVSGLRRHACSEPGQF